MSGEGLFAPDLLILQWFADSEKAWFDDDLLTGSAPGAMAGAASSVFSASGIVVGSGVFSGSSSPAFNGSATIRGSGAVSGASAPTFTVSASGQMLAALSGAVSVTFSPVGELAGAGSLVGASAFGFGLAGTLEDAGGALTAISGSVGVSITASGAMSAEAEQQAVHSRPKRRIRGRRTFFPDELNTVDAPTATAAAVKPFVPALAPLVEQLERARTETAALVVQIEAERATEARTQVIAGIEAELRVATKAMEAAKAREAAWVERLRDEDDLFLMVA